MAYFDATYERVLCDKILCKVFVRYTLHAADGYGEYYIDAVDFTRKESVVSAMETILQNDQYFHDWLHKVANDYAVYEDDRR